ncbi:YceD family protein [Spirulina sp. CS-785/01]|uniref:YceD family protein n=1 Tax=Spirulina sp. CS-785/01 TaxID=3021716 RepID=UPI00232E0C28|nr:YceD family protein [Spirulina sp. CS-785/01]MDB9313450.1 YceD family protein [Spirulina sp. CS-785/01]
MQPIYLPQLLKAPNQSEHLEINQLIEGLETLTPVRGELLVTHQGNYLEVSGTVETITTLVCHRCLQHYNHRLKVEKTELIWLNAAESEFPDSGEKELLGDEGTETLAPDGYFEPDLWVYEQLSLELPLQQICGENCPGIVQPQQTEDPKIDSRWAGLEALKQQIMNHEQ